MTDVYYDIKNDDGIPCIVTTEKSFWDKNQCLDDGSTQTYYDIYNAMEAAGAGELSESVFALEEGLTEQSIISAMANAGLRFIRNPSLV